MNRSVLRGMLVISIALAVIIVMLVVPTPKKKVVHPNNDPWLLVNYNPDDQYGTYLGNGFISTRIMGDGVGSQNGNPLPCFMAGLYDNEKLIPCPTWSDLRFYDGKTRFKIDKNADYKQVLNMKTGILTTYATWRAGSKTLKGKIEVIVSRAEPNVGLISAQIIPNFTGQIDLCSMMHAELLNCAGGKYVETHDLGYAEISAFLFAKKVYLGMVTTLNTDANFSHEDISGGDMAQNLRIDVTENHLFSVTRYGSFAVGNNAVSVQATAMKMLKVAAASDDKFIAAHKSAWAKLWQKDIVIDGPRKDQQAIHSCMFYLLQSVREGSQWSIPPMGLSDNAFSGHVFWDADVWMFPALILQHPELAKAIVDYRYNTLPGAMANAKAGGYKGADYAWESGYTGKEDTPTDLVYRNERHINGDVALAQWQYYLATNDLNWLKNRGYPVIKAVADYWTSRVKLLPPKELYRHPASLCYQILQVVPPDENAELVNNSVYTNAIAKTALDIAVQAAKLTGVASNPEWSRISANIYIPFDSKEKRFIAFDGYKGVKAKQADSELLIYPMQFSYKAISLTNIYKNTYAFYAPKADKNGPAMTSSAHAVIEARFGNRDNAYSKFRASYQPFLRGSFNYFNEKRSKIYTNMCFLTGAAGPIQSTIFGLAGTRMNYFPTSPSDYNLQFKPCLPKQWKSLKITGMQWRGKTFDLMVSHEDKVNITPR